MRLDHYQGAGPVHFNCGQQHNFTNRRDSKLLFPMILISLFYDLDHL